jgi:hypothetical protein
LEVEMRKTTMRLAAIGAALCITASIALVLGGCGGSGKSSAQAREVLDAATSTMAALKYVKEAGSNSMVSEDSSVPAVEVTFQSEMDFTDPSNPQAHTTIGQSNIEMNVYASGGFVYTEGVSGNWQKVKTEGASSLAPKDLKEIAAGAKNVRLTSEGPGQYEVSFDVGAQALKDSDLLGGTDQETAPGKQAEEALKQLKIKAVYTIAKDTKYVTRARLDMRMPAVAEAGETSGLMTVDFSGFNEPVSVVLPEAAKSATCK